MKVNRNREGQKKRKENSIDYLYVWRWPRKVRYFVSFLFGIFHGTTITNVNNASLCFFFTFFGLSPLSVYIHTAHHLRHFAAIEFMSCLRFVRQTDCDWAKLEPWTQIVIGSFPSKQKIRFLSAMLFRNGKRDGDFCF